MIYDVIQSVGLLALKTLRKVSNILAVKLYMLLTDSDQN